MLGSAVGKCTQPLTFAELPPPVHAGHRGRASKTVALNKRWNLEVMAPGAGLPRPPRPLCESETAGTRGGQKCSVITQSTARWDPLSGLTEAGQTPTIRWCVCTRPPGGSSRQLRNVRTEIRQGLQLEGEFQPSWLLSPGCLLFASRSRSTSASVAIPPSRFSYCSCSRARVTQAATSERDGKLIANSSRNKGESLNWSGKTGPMKRVFVNRQCAYYDVIQSQRVEPSSPVLPFIHISSLFLTRAAPSWAESVQNQSAAAASPWSEADGKTQRCGCHLPSSLGGCSVSHTFQGAVLNQERGRECKRQHPELRFCFWTTAAE